MNSMHKLASEASIWRSSIPTKAVRAFLALTVALTMLAIPMLTAPIQPATSHIGEEIPHFVHHICNSCGEEIPQFVQPSGKEIAGGLSGGGVL